MLVNLHNSFIHYYVKLALQFVVNEFMNPTTLCQVSTKNEKICYKHVVQ